MSLKPGDLCVIIGGLPGSYNDAQPGDIVELIAPAPPDSWIKKPAWEVRKKSGGNCLAHEVCLRKIDPNDDSRKVVSWDECPWKPKKEILV